MTTLIGFSSVGTYDYGNFNGKGYIKFPALATGKLTSILFYLNDLKGTYMRLGIYSDNAGTPGTVLGQAVVGTLTAYTWVSVTGLSVELTKDTNYWLAVCFDGIGRAEATGATYRNKTSTGNVAFGDAPAVGSAYAGKVSIYGTGTESVSITVSAVTMTATAATLTPAVVGGTDKTVSAVTATGSAAAAVPTVTTQFYRNISGALATADAEAFAPSIHIFADTEVQTVNIDARAQTPAVTAQIYVTIPAPLSAADAAPAAPTIEGGTGVAPSTLVADATIPAPQVFVTQAHSEVSLVGERLEVIHDPAITTTAAAGYVAIAVLVKARLDGKKGTITIPPICNLELWDVLSTYDDPAAQDSNYRVCGYTFDYDTRRAAYRHTLDLCAP